MSLILLIYKKCTTENFIIEYTKFPLDDILADVLSLLL